MQKYIIYDGLKFYQTKQGYYLGHIGDKPIRLHRYVWSKYNGDIPKGYVVHHKDHDKSNNDISNLVLLSSFNHSSMHGKERADRMREMADKYRPLTAEWHHSEEGRKWHSEHWPTSIGDKLERDVEKECLVCGKHFFVNKMVANRSKFCSNNCKSYYRRHSGVDDIEVVCPICGSKFKTNKYSRAKFCSEKCEYLHRRKK